MMPREKLQNTSSIGASIGTVCLGFITVMHLSYVTGRDYYHSYFAIAVELVVWLVIPLVFCGALCSIGYWVLLRKHIDVLERRKPERWTSRGRYENEKNVGRAVII